MEQLPKYQELIAPMLKILSRSGVALHNNEIEAAVALELNISESLRVAIHSGTRTELGYRLGWAKTKAKESGWLVSPKREHWFITDLGKNQFV